MSKLHEITARATSSAPPDAVWRLLADVATWSEWSDFDRSELERAAEDGSQGVGSVRRFRRGPLTTRERVIALRPPTHLAYELVSGLPIRDYNANVVLIPTESGGTEIQWGSRFRSRWPVPGGLVRPGLARFVQETATKLAHAAEREDAATAEAAHQA